MTLYLGNNLISGVATPTEPTRNLGQIIESIVPLTDAGLHLLDGALINGSGIYSAFVDAIADLVTDYPDLFETEANWQSSVSTYGVCGKFVYDSVANTVRLPKVTGILEGTTDATALGDLIEQYVKLPNITGYVGGNNLTTSENPHSDGALYYGSESWTGPDVQGTYYGPAVHIDASRSSSVYSGNGSDTKIQQQAIKCFYYIVIATTTKTDIEVDIDEVTTDLNGKADTDLSNVPTSKGILTESYVNGTSWYRVYSDGWCEQGGQISASGTVTFLKAFANANYSITFATKRTGAGSGLPNLVYDSQTSTSVYIFLDYITANRNAGGCWIANGYIR